MDYIYTAVFFLLVGGVAGFVLHRYIAAKVQAGIAAVSVVAQKL